MYVERFFAKCEDHVLVKWSGVSMLHLRWVSVPNLLLHMTEPYLKRKIQKLPCDVPTTVLSSVDALRVECVVSTVKRRCLPVTDEFYNEPPALHDFYLPTVPLGQNLPDREAIFVKWFGLPFSECTWEWADDAAVRWYDHWPELPPPLSEERLGTVHTRTLFEQWYAEHTASVLQSPLVGDEYRGRSALAGIVSKRQKETVVIVCSHNHTLNEWLHHFLELFGSIQLLVIRDPVEGQARDLLVSQKPRIVLVSVKAWEASQKFFQKWKNHCLLVVDLWPPMQDQDKWKIFIKALGTTRSVLKRTLLDWKERILVLSDPSLFSLPDQVCFCPDQAVLSWTYKVEEDGLTLEMKPLILDLQTSSIVTSTETRSRLRRIHQKLLVLESSLRKPPPQPQPVRFRVNLKEKDPFKVLNVPRDATVSRIRHAYHQGVLHTHPDRVPGLEAEFSYLNQAYQTLLARYGNSQN